MNQLSKQPAFELGQIVATPGALAALKKAGQQPRKFLARHANREWGDLPDGDRKENAYSLEYVKAGTVLRARSIQPFENAVTVQVGLSAQIIAEGDYTEALRGSRSGLEHRMKIEIVHCPT
jgi:hypothetical protein